MAIHPLFAIMHLGGFSIFGPDLIPMQAYDKPYKNLREQLEILKSRGLTVADEKQAVECLHRNGYYRLSAYWYPFREIKGDKRTDVFLPESTFEDAQKLYVFDKEFKLLLLDAIERVEIAVRVEIALCLGQHNKFAYSDPVYFRPSFTTPNEEGISKHSIWLEKYRDAFENSKEEFVRHHKDKYGETALLPIWIAIELWDFGRLSTFYSGMLTADCVCVASRFEVLHWRVMASWLHTLNYTRNVIAHHGRLWNRRIAVPPKSAPNTMPNFQPVFAHPESGRRVYSICCILAHLSKVINPNSGWQHRFVNFVNAFPQMPYASLQSMGFPEDWQHHAFWK